MTSSENNNNIIEQARDFIHEKVATDEQLQQEKPIDQKIQDAIPSDPQDAVNRVSNAAKNVTQDIQDRFNKRLDEGTDRAGKKQEITRSVLMDRMREKAYEATKSPEVQQREAFNQASIPEKMNILQEKEDEKNKDTVPGASLMS